MPCHILLLHNWNSESITSLRDEGSKLVARVLVQRHSTVSTWLRFLSPTCLHASKIILLCPVYIGGGPGSWKGCIMLFYSVLQKPFASAMA